MDMGDNLTSVFDDDDLKSIKSGGQYDVIKSKTIIEVIDTDSANIVRTDGV